MHHDKWIAVRLLGVHVEIAIFRGWRNLLQLLPGLVHFALLRLASLPHFRPRRLVTWRRRVPAAGHTGQESAAQGKRNRQNLGAPLAIYRETRSRGMRPGHKIKHSKGNTKSRQSVRNQ